MVGGVGGRWWEVAEDGDGGGVFGNRCWCRWLVGVQRCWMFILERHDCLIMFAGFSFDLGILQHVCLIMFVGFSFDLAILYEMGV
ncbi:hypothetical protein Hanom_Chr05g00401851 [Helianthus anomalus]